MKKLRKTKKLKISLLEFTLNMLKCVYHTVCILNFHFYLNKKNTLKYFDLGKESVEKN